MPVSPAPSKNEERALSTSAISPNRQAFSNCPAPSSLHPSVAFEISWTVLHRLFNPRCNRALSISNADIFFPIAFPPPPSIFDRPPHRVASLYFPLRQPARLSRVRARSDSHAGLSLSRVKNVRGRCVFVLTPPRRENSRALDLERILKGTFLTREAYATRSFRTEYLSLCCSFFASIHSERAKTPVKD